MSTILLATDAPWVRNEIHAALDGSDTTVKVVGDGRHVVKACQASLPDLVICDLQVGNMGGVATTMAIRHEESGGRMEHVPVLMLLDRVADVHLARRSGAEGWIVKPLDAVRLRAAARALLSGGTYSEGVSGAPVPEVEESTEPEVVSAS
jgi:DNA-binding response OmpR family regulator